MIFLNKVICCLNVQYTANNNNKSTDATNRPVGQSNIGKAYLNKYLVYEDYVGITIKLRRSSLQTPKTQNVFLGQSD